MTDRFTSMLRRNLKANWNTDLGPLDLRNHSIGIGGVHSGPMPAKVIEATAALKPRLIRIFLQEFFYIYPGRGIFDWSKMDAYMDAARATGAEIMASICIKPNALYPNVDEKIWMPNDVCEWQELIRRMVLRYSREKNYVTHWAVANETNIGEWGGCPYLIESPDDFFEYYKITAAPIRDALPEVKVGGPSHAGGDAAEYLSRFVGLCKSNNVPVDFVCYNAYRDDPDAHAADARLIREALEKHDKEINLYMTEFNIGIGEELSLEEKAYDPKRAACQASSILAFREDGKLDGSFQYHIYDQMNDPNEFAPWYARTRYMAEHWNDVPHRCGLLDQSGKPRPQYFLYKMIYELTGRRVVLSGTDAVLRGVASRSADGKLFLFLSNYAERGTQDAVAKIYFENAPEGVYRLNVYRIDGESSARMKAARPEEISYCLPACENRPVYVHPDFHFDVFTPADSATLIDFAPLEDE